MLLHQPGYLEIDGKAIGRFPVFLQRRSQMLLKKIVYINRKIAIL
jgi:hypothetical protein